MDNRETAGVGRALGLGVAQAMSLPPVTLGMFGARLLRAWSAAVLLAVLAREPSGAGGWALAGLVGLGLLAAAVLRNGLLAAALVQGRARMQGEFPATFGEALARGLSRGLGYLWVGGALELLGSAWAQVSLLAAGWAWVLSLGKGLGGVLPSAALAASLLGGLAVTWGAGLWVDLALARATAAGMPFSVGILLSAPGSGARWGSAVVAVVACNVAGAVLEITASLPLAVLTGGLGQGDVTSTLLGQLGGGFAAALAWSLSDHVRAQALLALQLDFPAPPPVVWIQPPAEPSPVPVAEIVAPSSEGDPGAAT